MSPFYDKLVTLIVGLSLSHLTDACCHKVSIDYEIHPSGASTGNILQCLMGNIVFSRAVRFNSFEECVLMDAEWNSNPTFEAGNTYAWISTYERRFDETNDVESGIPDNFGVGSSVDVIFRTAPISQYWFNIDIKHNTTDERFLHMDIRPNLGVIVLNSKENGPWGTEVHVNNTIDQGDSIYIAQIRYSMDTWDIYINGSLLYNFERRQNYTGDANINFKGSDTHCLRIIYYGPW